MGYRPRVDASYPTRTQYSEWAPVGFFVSQGLRGVKWEGPGSRPILSGEGAMDSRLRGNDVDRGGIDVDGSGNDGDGGGNDGDRGMTGAGVACEDVHLLAGDRPPFSPCRPRRRSSCRRN